MGTTTCWLVWALGFSFGSIRLAGPVAGLCGLPDLAFGSIGLVGPTIGGGPKTLETKMEGRSPPATHIQQTKERPNIEGKEISQCVIDENKECPKKLPRTFGK